MSKIVNHEEYWEIREVLDYLSMSRTTFYREGGPKQRLREYTFEGKTKPWYRREEVVALAEGRLDERPHIVIRGILRDWTAYARSVGLQIDTVNCTVEVGVQLPRDVCSWLPVKPETAFVKRSRISFVEGVPVCHWATYYPLVLVGQFLERIKVDEEFNIVAALLEQRGVTITRAKDRYRAREAGLFEQEILQLKRPETVLQLQRAAYSERGKLVLYSDMALLGSWFEPEIEYPVNHW